MSVADRVKEAEKSALPGRLRKGARILGRLYLEGQRCISGWSRICPCMKPSEFCDAKKRWVILNDEYYGGPPFGLAGHEPFYVIEAMTISQWRESGLTATVQVLGDQQIRVGVHGTTWKTIADLAELQDDDAALAVAVDAVVKLQRAEFSNGGK